MIYGFYYYIFLKFYLIILDKYSSSIQKKVGTYEGKFLYLGNFGKCFFFFCIKENKVFLGKKKRKKEESFSTLENPC